MANRAVQRKKRTILRQISWKGKWANTLSTARKNNEKTLGNVSISVLSVFFFTYGQDPSSTRLTA